MAKIKPAMAFVAMVALAQTQSPKNGSISGVVRDAGTGTPKADVTISVYTHTRFANQAMYMSSQSKEIRDVTDSQGRYRLGDLPPGTYGVSARSNDRYRPFGAKMVNLRAGQDLTSIDFAFAANGSIAGRVLDQNKEPVPGAVVYLVSKEYTMSGVGYLLKGAARTDDQGAYTLRRVEPGYPYLLVARACPTFPAIRSRQVTPQESART